MLCSRLVRVTTQLYQTTPSVVKTEPNNIWTRHEFKDMTDSLSGRPGHGHEQTGQGPHDRLGYQEAQDTAMSLRDEAHITQLVAGG